MFARIKRTDKSKFETPMFLHGIFLKGSLVRLLSAKKHPVRESEGCQPHLHGSAQGVFLDFIDNYCTMTFCFLRTHWAKRKAMRVMARAMMANTCWA